MIQKKLIINPLILMQFFFCFFNSPQPRKHVRILIIRNSGAPNKNIVQNHLKIALLNVC